MKVLLKGAICLLIASIYGCTIENESKSRQVSIPSDNAEKDTILTEQKDTIDNDSVFIAASKPDFRDVIASFEDYGFFPLPLTDWYYTYRYGLEDENKDSCFFTKDESFVFTGTDSNREQIDVIFDNVDVSELVLKSDGKHESNLRGSVKIFEFKFESIKATESNMYKIKQIAKFILSTRGLKNPRMLWQHDNCIYIFQIRAVMFERDIRKVLDIFKERISFNQTNYAAGNDSIHQ